MNENQTQQYDILMVDDDEILGSHTAEALECFEFKVQHAINAEQGYEALRKKLPSLILLDLNMPEVSGHEVCETIRTKLRLQTPILVLSGNKDESDIVKALEVGADDFVAKTTSFEILLAHIRAVLRRTKRQAQNENSSLITWGPLEFDQTACEVRLQNEVLDLTPNENKLLEIFISSPGVVFTRAQLIEKLHGAGYHLTERTIDVHINGLRTKLGPLRYALETVRSVGYRFSKAPL